MTDSETRAVVTWRDYVDVRLQAIENRMASVEVKAANGGYFTRAEHVLYKDVVDNAISGLRERNARAEGKASQTSVMLFGAVSVISLLVAIAALIAELRK